MARSPGANSRYGGSPAFASRVLPKYAIEKIPTEFNSVWTWADLRKGAEAMNPFDYFKYRYYEKWLGGISSFFVEQGYISQAELDAKTAAYLDIDEVPAPEWRNEAIDGQVIEYLRDQVATRVLDYSIT